MFDVEHFRSLMPMSEEEERHLLGLFLENQQRLLESLRDAATGGDPDLDTMAQLGHRLKSSARSVGAEHLSHTCQQLEYACEADAGDAARDMALVAIDRARQLEREIRLHLGVQDG